MHADFPNVQASHLEGQARRALRREQITSVLTLLATAWLAWYWWGEFSSTMPWLGLSLFAVLWLAPMFLVTPTGVALEEAAPELLGPYTRQDLERIVGEVCQAYGERETPKLYILESKQGAALVLNVDVLNFVRPWNALYVGQYFLHSLDELELKALLAHEMCHFSQHYTVRTRFFYVAALVSAVWITTLLSFPLRWLADHFDSGWGFWLAVIACCFLGVARLAYVIATFLFGIVAVVSHRFDSQQVEALCDLEAARRYGLEPTVNVLLKVGTRQEIFVTMLAELSPDPKRPIGWGNPGSRFGGDKEDKEQIKVQKSAVDAAMGKLQEVLPPGFVSLDQARPYIEQALEAGTAVEGARRFQHQAKGVLRWLSYDVRVKNNRLDSKELQGLLADLAEQPDRPLLDLPADVHSDLARQADHPAMRDRILFLAHNLSAGGGDAREAGEPDRA